jgi:hypothetical protein
MLHFTAVSHLLDIYQFDAEGVVREISRRSLRG